MDASQRKKLNKPNQQPSKSSYQTYLEQKIVHIQQKDIKLKPSQNANYNEQMSQTLPQHEVIIQQLRLQIDKLTQKNKELTQQLFKFSRKLDEQIKKRQHPHDRKPKHILKPQEKQSIEVQGLHKKLQICKKQITQLKSKLSEDSEARIKDSQNKLKLQVKQNQELKTEVKALRKIIKMQEKGLSDIGAEGFLKIIGENDKLKQDVRKLRVEMDQVERKYRTNSSQIGKQLYTPQNDKQKIYFQRISKNQTTSNKTTLHDRKKNLSQFRVKTLQDSRQLVTAENQSQLNLYKPNLKMEKLQSKIRSMNAQKLRQREILDNLKVQIIQKDKEIHYLQERIDALRKVPKAKKDKTHSQSVIIENLNQSTPVIEQLQLRQQSRLTLNKQKQYIHEYQENQKPQQTITLKNRYPRLQQHGEKRDSSYKWSHYQFSSKIKEIQVYTHQKGHIQYIHARYQKGEPNKTAQLQSKRFSALLCEQSEEFVTQVKGGFKYGYLQYVVLKTSRKRVVELGNVNIESQCETFSFNIHSDEYPCAFFGQNDSQGITRIGCFVERLLV